MGVEFASLRIGDLGATVAEAFSESVVTLDQAVNTSQANSAVIPGLAVQFVMPTDLVIVEFTGLLAFDNVSAAAGTKVTVNAYIHDTDLASGAPVASSALFSVRQVFTDTTAVRHGTPFFRALAVVQAAVGASKTLQGRVYISAGAAATWNVTLLGNTAMSRLSARRAA